MAFDRSTKDENVTLAGTPDYITISGQTITRGSIDLTADVTGTMPVGNGGTGLSAITSGHVLYASGSNTIAAAAPGNTSGVQAYDADTAKLDVAQTFTASQRGEVTALTDGANISTDLADSNNFSVTLAGNRTLDNPTNLVAGQSGTIVLTQDGTGSRTLAYGAYWKFIGGTAPTLTTTASAVDVLVYYVESSTRITAKVLLDVK
tara:strand:+ start:1326 stop:1940 length:615 start_codon:yes stop_codon:yes gene_type:complete